MESWPHKIFKTNFGSIYHRTGFPVHVNAFFALSDDRRSLKWLTADDHGDEAKWNKLLIEGSIMILGLDFLSLYAVGD